MMGTCCNIMASRAWATEVEVQMLDWSKLQTKYSQIILFILLTIVHVVTLGKVHRW